MNAVLRPVVLPEDLIGKCAPCDLFNVRGVLLVSADSVIAFSIRNPFRPTKVFCRADQADRISDVNPIVLVGCIGKTLAEIAKRLALSQAVAEDELTKLSQIVYDTWIHDADACLGYAQQYKPERPSIRHVVLVSFLVAEMAAAHRLDRAQTTNLIGGALTMNIAKLTLHDEMYARAERPSKEQIFEIHAHPSESVRLLGHIGRFEKQWLDAVGSHHENIDGSGYPGSLAGSQIALPARMLRVADIFAARLTGRRSRRSMHWNIQRTRNTQNIVDHIFGRDQQLLDPTLMTQLVGALGRFPPGCLVRLNNMELAVIPRRIPGQQGIPCEALSIRDSVGNILKTPRQRAIRHGEYRIRNYANDESQRLVSYNWPPIWGYSG